MNTQLNPIAMMSEANFFKGYSRWDDDKAGYENWDESVARVMNMHRSKYADVMTPELSEMIDFAETAYRDKLILGAQRALQFGGDQIMKHNARLYNCSFSYANRPVFFQHAMYLLLAGCGVGFSVQKHHVAQLPSIKRPAPQMKVFMIPDSIEGWADAFGVLLSSYFISDSPFPGYKNSTVQFDYSKIRAEGAFISGGFKAPGPKGLEKALELCRQLLDLALTDKLTTSLSPIEVYDFVMHMADAVISGGVRRAATLCLFSKDDEAMMTAKTGNWFETNPQRARSNNSALLIRDHTSKAEFDRLIERAKQFGEPGFVFADDTEFGFNPCVEIGMRALTALGKSGFQFCNLTETNGGLCVDLETLLRASKASAILGTLQAGYTEFHYLDEASREITEREALLGCSITGWMANPDVLFDEENMRAAAKAVLETNKIVAKMIGINAAARATTAKPSGNASVLLGCPSGIHGEHAPRYFRNIQINRMEEIAQLMALKNPDMINDMNWDPSHRDIIASFPITIDNDNVKFKRDLLGVRQLEYVKKAQQAYIEAGTDIELCVDKRLRHNISNTITVDCWDTVGDYIYENRHSFAGVSLMSQYGDRAFAQSPFTEVYEEATIVANYGEEVLSLDNLIAQAQRAFNNNLWTACNTLMGFGVKDETCTPAMHDWCAHAREHAETLFAGDSQRLTDALKDVFNLRLWDQIQATLTDIDFSAELKQKSFTDVNTMGAQACAGGVCEISI